MLHRDKEEEAGWLTGRRFLIGLCLFFGSIFAANGIMVFYALSTFDGVETDDAYRKGRAYNHVLEADAAQSALGWKTAVETTPAYTDGAVQLSVSVKMTDADARGLSLAPVTLTFWRPTVQGMDVTAPLAALGDGIYRGTVQLAEAGNWIVRLRTQTPEGQPYLYEERLFVPPPPGDGPR